MNKLVVMVAVLGACSPSTRYKVATTFVVAEVACDVGQTARALQLPHRYERNPLLGDQPGGALLITAGLAAVAATIAGAEGAGYLAGSRWRWVVPAAVGLAESAVLVSNATHIDRPFCGAF